MGKEAHRRLAAVLAADVVGYGRLMGEDEAGTLVALGAHREAPIEPNSEISVRFATYDSGDAVLDSLTLVDNFQWIAEPGTSVGTVPIENPK